MAIPNCQDIVARLAAEYPAEWREAHTGSARTEDFIKRLAYVLHTTVDANFGLNGKRGNPNDLSDDALNYKGVGPGHDPTHGGIPVTVIDVIAGAGGPDPRPSWQVFDTLPGPGAWVKPEPVGGSAGGIDPSPIEPPPPPASDLQAVLAMATAIAADLSKLSERVSAVDARVASLGNSLYDKLTYIETEADAAHFEALNAASRASEIKTALESKGGQSFPVYEGRLFGQRLTLTPKG